MSPIGQKRTFAKRAWQGSPSGTSEQTRMHDFSHADSIAEQRTLQSLLPAKPTFFFMWTGLLLMLGGVVLPVLASQFPPGSVRSICLWLAVLCWFFGPIWLPYRVIKTGTITQRTSVTYRSDEPLRFWIGLVALELLYIFFSSVACLFLFATIWP
jgi:hypothetical protein